MANVYRDGDSGRRIIQFKGADGKRRSIRLGKVSQKDAEAVLLKVEDLANAAVMSGTPRRDTAEWVRGLGDDFHAKLAAVGLVEPRASGTLKAFIDDYIATRGDVKSSTATVYHRARRYLLEYFDAGQALRSITPGDADRWRLHLQQRKPKLSDNTIRRACGLAKQFFNAALRQKLVDENPFADLQSSVVANPSRYHFISREDAQRVLDACPDEQWRLLFALARYGGLRVPSEVLLLRWQDIDWEAGRFLVRSPKTEHHAGKASREVPLVPELLQYLREAFEVAEPGSEFCITRYRSSAVNLRTQLQRIIERAGLEPWPKLWQNLRSTRETELTGQYPIHVITSWIGNTEKVANKHYLQVTDEHFRQAAADASALQNPVQQVDAANRSEAHQSTEPESQGSGDAVVSNSVQSGAAEGSSKKVEKSGRYWTRTSDLCSVIAAL